MTSALHASGFTWVTFVDEWHLDTASLAASNTSFRASFAAETPANSKSESVVLVAVGSLGSRINCERFLNLRVCGLCQNLEKLHLASLYTMIN